MKTYFIKIDLNSIKKNKDAGSTQTVVLGDRTVEFEAENLPIEFKDGENCIIKQWQINENGYKCNYEGIILNDDLLDKIIEREIKHVQVTINNNYSRINHMPIPTYSYAYEDKKVECDNCNSIFNYKSLKYDESSDNHSYSVCPVCGTWDCVELEYEKIKDALKRKQEKYSQDCDHPMEFRINYHDSAVVCKNVIV